MRGNRNNPFLSYLLKIVLLNRLTIDDELIYQIIVDHSQLERLSIAVDGGDERADRRILLDEALGRIGHQSGRVQIGIFHANDQRCRGEAFLLRHFLGLIISQSTISVEFFFTCLKSQFFL